MDIDRTARLRAPGGRLRALGGHAGSDVGARGLRLQDGIGQADDRGDQGCRDPHGGWHPHEGDEDDDHQGAKTEVAEAARIHGRHARSAR